VVEIQTARLVPNAAEKQSSEQSQELSKTDQGKEKGPQFAAVLEKIVSRLQETEEHAAKSKKTAEQLSRVLHKESEQMGEKAAGKNQGKSSVGAEADESISLLRNLFAGEKGEQSLEKVLETLVKGGAKVTSEETAGKSKEKQGKGLVAAEAKENQAEKSSEKSDVNLNSLLASGEDGSQKAGKGATKATGGKGESAQTAREAKHSNPTKSAKLNQEAGNAEAGRSKGTIVIDMENNGSIEKQINKKGAGKKADSQGKNTKGGVTIIDKRSPVDPSVKQLQSQSGSSGNQMSGQGSEQEVNEQFAKLVRGEFVSQEEMRESGMERHFTRNTVTRQDQTNLLKQMRSGGNSEIIKQAKFILKNKNSGEIRLTLKPERLGNVRIKLNLQDNNIVGRVIVENINIKEVFEHNLESLQRAFREEGFSSASLDVSVGGEQDRRKQDESDVAGQGYYQWDEGSFSKAGDYEDYGHYLVDQENMVNLVI
jgi:flagellar hook-length control protein FliK